MEKKTTKLKKLDMTSVDLVKRGANQAADICFFKSAEGQEEEVPHGLLKSIQETVKNWFTGAKANEEAEDFGVTKANYMEALDYSIDSILNDSTMDGVAKAEMAAESIEDFCDAMKAQVAKTMGATPAEYDPGAGQVGKTFEYEEGENEVRIDKSRFTEEELQAYQRLIAKGTVSDDDDGYVPEVSREDEEGDEEMNPDVKKALEEARQEIETMKKSFEMKELHEIAKKYTTLGKKEDELADKLYNMKKSSPEAYDSYVALLDEQLDLVNKSGMFEEIGKSGHGAYVAGGDTVGKIESIATDIMKSDPEMTRPEAIMKAWEQHPELLADYENKYRN